MAKPLTNLLTDPWITVRRRSGGELTIQPSQITDDILVDPIVDIVAPRPDFRSALYQFCIGLLQTSCMLEDEHEWLEWWKEPPKPAELTARMGPFVPAFVVAGDGPLFMQDLSLRGGPDKELNTINSLLLDGASDKSVKENRDHFVKRGAVPCVSIQYAIQALVSLQYMCPGSGGGGGQFTSIRGAGPLTTLLIPGQNTPDTLWHRVWLNVLDGPSWSITPGSHEGAGLTERIFPWMAENPISDTRVHDLTPDSAHSLQHYWAMPRRTLLDETDDIHAACTFGGPAPFISGFRRRTRGYRYSSEFWRHPLSPYYRDKNDKALPVHPHPGGFQYQHWHEWAQPPSNDGPRNLCAQVVANHLLSPIRSRISARLWASGYDMDQGKVRCFYERIWPVFHFPEEHAISAHNTVAALAALASRAVSFTRSHVREAWLRRPGDHSDGTNNVSAGVAAHVYEASEQNFFALLAQLHAYSTGGDANPIDGESWRDELLRLAFKTFDAYVPVESIAHADPARIARARNGLLRNMHGAKMQTHIDDIANAMDDILSTRTTEPEND